MNSWASGSADTGVQMCLDKQTTSGPTSMPLSACLRGGPHPGGGRPPSGWPLPAPSPRPSHGLMVRQADPTISPAPTLDTQQSEVEAPPALQADPSDIAATPETNSAAAPSDASSSAAPNAPEFGRIEPHRTTGIRNCRQSSRRHPRSLHPTSQQRHPRDPPQATQQRRPLQSPQASKRQRPPAR